MRRITDGATRQGVSAKTLIRLCFFWIVAFAAAEATAQPGTFYGRFIGQLHLVPDSDGVRMRLVEPFAFVDASGGVWAAPAGTVTDGASIPAVARSFIGGSWDGPYRGAAVIHDVACMQRTRPWEMVHLTFFHAMLASGVSTTTAKVMYAAVFHFGPRWTPDGRPYMPWGLVRARAEQRAQERANMRLNAMDQHRSGAVPHTRSADYAPVLEVDRVNAERAELSRLAEVIGQMETTGRGLTIEQIQNLE